ncbi:MAG: bifunctional tetrahydrofolate synthase/dihydrofolate synthase [Spongiibacteraceae bacterium]
MRYDTLQDWLQWLETCHPSEIDLGLARVGHVAELMALSLGDTKVVTVAGTNGKGSCVASLNALLLSAGYQVGCFTSPHFLRYNERILLNGQQVTDQLLIESFQRIDQARGDISLTYFEFGTLAALDIFQRQQLDVVILEVGLGGRLDAVNIIDADIAIVTSIDIDHQQWLGTDREVIGREKAGIFRAGKVAISAGNTPPASLRASAQACAAIFYQAGEHFRASSNPAVQNWSWKGLSVTGTAFELYDLPAVSLPPESVVAAIQALHLLDLSMHRVDYSCLARINLPGRFQQVFIEKRQVILDVAHNPAAADYLAQRLQQEASAGRTFALMGVMADKDVEGIISALRECVSVWFIADLQHCPRALAAPVLADKVEKLTKADVRSFTSIAEAARVALQQMTDEDRLIVFGSFITVAEMLVLLPLNNLEVTE